MIASLKSAARSVAGNPIVGRLLWQLQRGRNAVVMMHRFAVPGMPHVGHDAGELRTLLSYLRQCGVELLSLEDLVARATVGHSDIDMPAVAFTVDDGYHDVLSQGAPIFREFDCPWTLFVVPGAIDSRSLFWWDQIAWMMRNSRSKDWTIELPEGPTSVSWREAKTAFAVQKRLEERLKTLDPASLGEVLSQLSSQADVPLLRESTPEFEVLSWDELRALECCDVSIGAHSMTHPILSRCESSRASWEIEQSVARVRAELSAPSNYFCYPNGRLEDFGSREIDVLSRVNLRGALTSEHGVLLPNDASIGPDWHWRIPRISYDSRPGVFFGAFI